MATSSGGIFTTREKTPPTGLRLIVGGGIALNFFVLLAAFATFAFRPEPFVLTLLVIIIVISAVNVILLYGLLKFSTPAYIIYMSLLVLSMLSSIITLDILTFIINASIFGYLAAIHEYY